MNYVDVRSPGEFAHAHIPRAYNLPLFTDAERAEVGTLYKQKGAQIAFQTGLAFVQPKMEALIAEARTLPAPFTLHCARGGMRSQSLHSLFSEAGIACTTYSGGYKAYRREVLRTFERPFPFHVLTGLTGCGKTERLHQLKASGEQVLDLEKLANHRGSVFGTMGKQPSNEFFENLIAEELNSFSLTRPIWVEDESRLIGSCTLPNLIYAQMQKAPRTEVSCSPQERRTRLMRDYGTLSPRELIAGVKKLHKRLGHVRTKEAVEAIERNDLAHVLDMLLVYYDKAYQHGSNNRPGKKVVCQSHQEASCLE